MSSTYGEHLKLSIFGQSHGPAIGMTLDGIPAGLQVDMEELQVFLNRRAPGRHRYHTPRKEEDCPEILSGLVNDRTCGAPIAAVIQNRNTKSSDYDSLKTIPRPAHADYPAHIKYHGFQDSRGGGHFSGRLTAPLCIAGGMCLQWLKKMNIQIAAHIVSIGHISDDPSHIDPVAPNFSDLNKDFPVFDSKAAEKMQEAIENARKIGDSVGGIIECIVTGLPVGLGGPMFGGMEGKLAQILYGIPAVKGLSFGSGFYGSGLMGSENNDAYTVQNGHVTAETNNAGGILGGITTGMPVVFSLAVKPTPSISRPQQSVDLISMEETTLEVAGRHDPCIVPRAVPVVEAATAIAIFDALLGFKGENQWT